MSTEIITAIISAVTTLIVSIGTWQISNREAQRKQEQAMREMLNEHKKETGKQISELRSDLNRFDAQVQERLAVMDVNVKTLSEQVNKHNNLVDRMYKVENRTDLQDEQINHLKERLA